MAVEEALLDRSNLAVVLARLGAEISDWAISARHIENTVLPVHANTPTADVQQFDALVQHLDQLAAFLLRLSAATDDGAELDPADVDRLARPTTLSALRSRLTGQACDPGDPLASGEVEIW